ncbi:MAG TPA: transporter substrate-binding domain-containing protein, partial [bacterium]|nr:transporter substrate-binding domain-containing protein [bacterium]
MRRFVLASLFCGGLALAATAAAQEEAPGPPTPPHDLLVGTKVVKPFAFRDAEGQWTGIAIELWEEIARARGWRFEWREAPNTNALVDMVAAGDVDVGIAAITMKPSRAERVDFSNSMFQSGLGIATSTQDPSPLAMLSVLVSPQFLGGVGTLAAVLLGVGVLVWFFERRGNAEEFERDPRRGLWSAFWWSAVTMTTVGYGDMAPKTAGGRVVALVWM